MFFKLSKCKSTKKIEINEKTSCFFDLPPLARNIKYIEPKIFGVLRENK